MSFLSIRSRPWLKAKKTNFLLTFILSFTSFIHPAFAQQTSSTSGLDASAYPDVTYCIDPDWLPYEAIRNNQHVGMSADYMRHIGELAQVNFVLVKSDSWEESLALLKKGTCDVASMLNRSPERETYLLFTQPYFSGTNVIVSRKEGSFIQGYEQIEEQKLGVVASYRLAEYIANYYAEINLQLVANETEGLRMLAEGEIDLFVGSMLSINAKIQKNGLSNIYISGVAEPQDNLSMGVTQNNTVLRDKLAQAIAALPESLHVQVYKEWSNIKVVDEIDYRFVWLALAVILLLVSVGVWRHQMTARFNRQLMIKNTQLELLQEELMDKNKSLEFMSMHDPLTDMFNRHYMLQRCEDERQICLRHNTPACLVIMDIDFFKPVNDNFGHSVGDEVLKALAKRITTTVRDMDVSARWGGEEFVVLCPQTSLQEASSLAERLRKNVSVSEFNEVGRITCSFGVAQFKPSESFTQWFDRADQALYEAKNTGRNKVVGI